MPEKARNYEKERRILMEALADSVLDMSDEELLEELRERGENPETVAEDVRSLLQRAAKSLLQRRLQEARQLHESRIAAIQRRKYRLPTSAEDRRSLLRGILTERPELRPGLLTAQWRDLKDLPDSAVESSLKQLIELGVLEGEAPSGEEG